ncbi:MFS transporter [Sulfurovum sp. ST-21]|uniref:MFS transporter n=1 Tax=Sulfurovum indicum TaxID=2779528 RepID=A0A7M1S844_9BACT|nr:MFS transporter [Sulfurovum indicum]QOR62520.1 MFS transporter [Sulfurovum indicum]
MSRYIRTLQHPVIARLSLIQLISYFGTWFSQVAIFSMLVEFKADAVLIAITAATAMLPAVVLAPIIGIVIDRIPFKRLMTTLLIIEIAMTTSFTLINSISLIWILLLLIFIRSAASSMLFSAEMSLFPKIIEGDMLKNTNEIHSIIWSFTYAAGMAAGGVVTYYLGYDTAFLIDAFLYTIALFILLGLKLDLEIHEPKQTHIQMLKSGFAYLKGNQKILHLIFLHASLGLTSFDALVTLLADFQYKELIAVPLAIGWINAIRATALMIGPFFIGRWINTQNLHYFFILEGAAIIVWSQVQFDFYWALVALFGVGFFTSTLWSQTYLMLQEETEKDFMGRVISYNDMFFMLSNIITALFIGYTSKWGLTLEEITFLLGIGFIAAAIYYLWFRKKYL